jgi:WD40 repeat protein
MTNFPMPPLNKPCLKMPTSSRNPLSQSLYLFAATFWITFLLPLPSNSRSEIGIALAQSPNHSVPAQASSGAFPAFCHNLRPLYTFSEHLGSVTAIAIAAQSEILVSGGEDGVVKVWNLQTGALLHQFSTDWISVSKVAISADARTIAAINDTDSYSSLAEPTQIKVWVLNRGELTDTLTSGTRVKAIAFTPDGKRLIAGGSRDRLETEEESTEGVVNIWNLETGQIDRTLANLSRYVVTEMDSRGQPIIATKPVATISSVEVSSQGDIIIAGQSKSENHQYEKN